MGYELAVRREIAVLSTLTHPNVTRLASAFRWRDGAFLVLEFCSGGDLQKLLSEVGSLGEDAAKFLMAEVCSGIHHIHSKGLAYGDCKPENIVLVGTGTGDACNESVGLHAKITDFAACRPFNSHGSQIMSNAINIIKNLRDGDWRAQHGLAEASGMQSTTLSQTSSSFLVPSETIDDTDIYDKDEDDRIEGTLEYLAPELASKRCQPSIATDAYAFGVTLFKVLTGELPNVEEIQSSSSSHSKVRFGGGGGGGGGATEGLFPLGFPPLAATLVTQLLSTDPNERLAPRGDFLSILNHPWFTEKNESFRGKTAEEIVNGDLASLPAPLVQDGLRGPPPDPAWSRRHNSTMWAPLPKEYQTLSPSQSSSQSTGKDIRRGKKSPTLLDFTNAEPNAILFKLLNV
jgi:serine/threonine protein kinase